VVELIPRTANDIDAAMVVCPLGMEPLLTGPDTVDHANEGEFENLRTDHGEQDRANGPRGKRHSARPHAHDCQREHSQDQGGAADHVEQCCVSQVKTSANLETAG
jgi:hypothetical protein